MHSGNEELFRRSHIENFPTCSNSNFGVNVINEGGFRMVELDSRHVDYVTPD